ncbi:MAG: TIR domain-containing protein [Thermoplasmatales archaeon]|nr:TIR domain-containing protein [Thermoplasmatales archaeon]
MADRKEPKRSQQHQIFLSYASDDKDIARKIADKLIKSGVRVWFDMYELKTGDSLAAAIRNAISASDYLVVLLSPNSVNSVWVQDELNAALSRELTTRDITLLPVVIADCKIPAALASRRYLDLRLNFDEGVDHLVEQIGLLPEIDFSILDYRLFENLVADLLSKLGFSDIRQEVAIEDLHVDIMALYPHIDPFGVKVIEKWLVEVKLYHKSRADLKSIHQLANYLSHLPEHCKGLLVTNSQLTSAAHGWLASAESKGRIQIRVIDGTELKRLLLQHKNLIYKYFLKSGRGQDE